MVFYMIYFLVFVSMSIQVMKSNLIKFPISIHIISYHINNIIISSNYSLITDH